MDADTPTIMPLLADLKAKGKGIVGMKVLGEGTLVENLDAALRFAVTKDLVHCFSIGCESRAEFLDNFARIAKVSQPS
jgi:predicted aldo/keto reductase-like oxidoreductase